MSDSSPPDFEGLATAVGLRLNARCECFEEAWQQGERPTLEDFLPKGGETQRQRVLVELVHADLECRLKAGEPAEQVERHTPAGPKVC